MENEGMLFETLKVLLEGILTTANIQKEIHSTLLRIETEMCKINGAGIHSIDDIKYDLDEINQNLTEISSEIGLLG